MSQLIKLGYLVKVIQSLSHEKRELIRNVVVIIRINLTNGEASATPVRSFSILRWLTKWPCLTMVLSLIHENQVIADEMLLIDMTNEFVNLYSARLKILSKLTDKDLQEFVFVYYLTLQNYIWFFSI